MLCLGPPSAHTVTIHVHHTDGAAAPSNATMRRIDSTHANPFAEWVGPMRNVSYPTKAQIARLDAVSLLIDESVAVTKLSDTVLAMTFEMPAEDSAVHIRI